MLSGLLNAMYGRNVQSALTVRRRFIRKGKVDAWEGSDKRTKEYRQALDDVASTISNLNEQIVRTRYNPETGKAELFQTRSDDAIVEVEIVCEDGKPDVAWVTVLSYLLPENLKACFVTSLPIRVEFKA